MTMTMRMWIVGVTMAGVAGLIVMASSTYAGDDGKELRDAVVKIAALLKKGDKAGAEKAAAVQAKKLGDLDELMLMFRPRNKGGVGVGSVPLANPAKDGIEVKLRELAREIPAGIAKETAALEETGWYVAAIAELANAKGWANPTGKKTKKAWKEHSDDLHVLGAAFAKAAAGKGGEIKTQAAKVNANCTNCHTIFKD